MKITHFFTSQKQFQDENKCLFSNLFEDSKDKYISVFWYFCPNRQPAWCMKKQIMYYGIMKQAIYLLTIHKMIGNNKR